MSKIKIRDTQNIFDIALQEYGNVEQLFDLISWLHSRNQNAETRAVVIQEREQAYYIGEAINYLYQNKYGIQAGHLKSIAKLLMHN